MSKLLSRHYRFARVALELASQSKSPTIHVLCALVVRKNRVLAVGYNSRKTSPHMPSRLQMLHAEVDAVLRVDPNELRGADVIVARSKNSGRPGLAKPCAVCEALLKRCGVRRVYYTTNSESADAPELGEMIL